MAAIRITVICTAPTARNGSTLPSMISSGLIGIASRFSIVPRSVSRVRPIAVIITIVICKMVPNSPGTMLYCVIPSGLYSLCTITFNAPGGTATVPSSNANPCCATVLSVDTAPEATEGSVASASISKVGESPRSTLRSKSEGMVTTNDTSPRRNSLSASSALTLMSVKW